MIQTRGVTPRRALGLLLLLIFLSTLVAGGCQDRVQAQRLSLKAQALWDSGRYEDAARNFVTLSELYPNTDAAEQALFFAANLYHHFLQDLPQAGRHYQHLIVTYPQGPRSDEAKENLAAVYEATPNSRHRALQIYRQLLLSESYRERRDILRFKIGRLNLELGRMDQARLMFRDLLSEHPDSPYSPETTYLVGYSYYLEKRYELADRVFEYTAKNFPDTPLAAQARYFIADTLEERGEMRKALAAFRALQKAFPNKAVVGKRIDALQKRIRRGVR